MRSSDALLPLFLLVAIFASSACADDDDRKKKKRPPPANQPPVASICVDRTSGPASLQVSADGSASSDPEGGALVHGWAFGDGATATGPVAAHAYAAPGTYDLVLTVTDEAGDTDVASEVVVVAPAAPPEPPVPAACGPGQVDYPHDAVSAAMYGAGETAYWIFEPDTPAPSTAPVVLFLHGWTAVDPAGYLAWIHHIVRRGHIVIYPVYQIVGQTPFADGTDHALQGVKDALVELGQPGHVAPDLSRVGAVGHSFGGMMTANFAVRAAAEGLPVIQAIMPVEPGALPTEWEDYGQIPAGTLILSIAGEDDIVVGDILARWIFDTSTAVSSADKDFLLVRTDTHGSPPLVADHGAPAGRITGQGVDALDFLGWWRWWDALTDAAWYGTNREQALGDTPEQRNLGTWSDGIPVLEPLVTD